MLRAAVAAVAEEGAAAGRAAARLGRQRGGVVAWGVEAYRLTREVLTRKGEVAGELGDLRGKRAALEVEVAALRRAVEPILKYAAGEIIAAQIEEKEALLEDLERQIELLDPLVG